ncbi:hypothetical protein HS125_16040 [bacterium]|nr:hypothetical protein [bacterium]
MALHRFLVPALPFLFLLWQTGVETLVEYGRRGALAWAGAVLLLAGAVYGGLGETLPGKESLWSYARRYAHGYREGLERTSIAVGKRLRLIAPPGARIALGDAGALPYYSGLAIIDLYGLMNRGLAHLPGHALYFDPGSFDVGTILSQRPEFIYLNSMNDYVRQRQPFQPLDHLQVDALIARNPSFVKDYRWVESAPFAPRQWCHLFARNDVELGTQRETK